MAQQPNPNEFKVWQNQTPVVNINTDLEFNVWQNQTPNADIDESYPITPTQTMRRRVMEF
jgi:hypothetical protein